VGIELRKDWLSIVLLVIIVAMGLEIIYLVQQNQRLRGLLARRPANVRPLNPNETVPAFTAQDISGDTLNIVYGPNQPHTLIFWFSASCPACEENLYFWNDLYRAHDSERLRFIGMCGDDPSEAQTLVSAYDLGFPVIHVADDSLSAAYRGHIVPQTMLISPRGVVLGLWPGSLPQQRQQDILATLEENHTLSMKGGDIP
jgi:peroxiredoxin